MSTAIASDVNEYENLEKELKRMSIEMCKLRKRKNMVAKRIIDYLNEKQQPGFKYKNMGIVLETKEKRKIKPKKLSTEESLRILNEAGVSDPNTVLKKLKETSSEREEIQKIKVINKKM